MFQRIELIFDGGIDARIGMPKQIHPPRTHAVQIASPVVVIQPNPIAALNRNQRQLLVRLHLRAGMPDGFEATAKVMLVMHCENKRLDNAIIRFFARIGDERNQNGIEPGGMTRALLQARIARSTAGSGFWQAKTKQWKALLKYN